MKIKIIILGMAASLLLPLAGSYARVAPDSAIDLPTGNAVDLPGQAVEAGVTKRHRGKGNGSKGKGRGRGSKGSKGSKGSSSPN